MDWVVGPHVEESFLQFTLACNKLVRLPRANILSLASYLLKRSSCTVQCSTLMADPLPLARKILELVVNVRQQQTVWLIARLCKLHKKYYSSGHL